METAIAADGPCKGTRFQLPDGAKVGDDVSLTKGDCAPPAAGSRDPGTKPMGGAIHIYRLAEDGVAYLVE